MAIYEREIEDNEAKIDNILHKILKMSESIADLVDYIKVNPDVPNEVIEACHKSDIMLETIKELILAADDIDIADEKLTEALENEIKDHLDKAIEHIKSVSIDKS